MQRFIFILLIGSATIARADTSLTVEAGWGDKIRSNRWTPLFVTVSDTQARQVTLELYAPQSRLSAMKVRQGFAIGPTPVTYPLYIPLVHSLDETLVVIRDLRSGKKLAEQFLQDPDAQNFSSNLSDKFIPAGDPFIGIGGRDSTARLLETQLQQIRLSSGYLPSAKLPRVARGYDNLSILILNEPDFDRISGDQQQAMVDWVLAGGNLVLWPGDLGVPPGSLWGGILPCKIGQTQVVEILPPALRRAGLAPRFKQLKARTLTPVDPSEPIPLLDTQAAEGFRRRLGLGQIIVLPIDAGSLQFDSPSAAFQFWNPILNSMLEMSDPSQQNSSPGNIFSTTDSHSTTDSRRANAITHTTSILGDIPGIGSFGFSYVAIVLIGMMIVVGPVDWFILKKLGRQPWTWVTTSGWIGLVTLSAIYIGHIFKSGDLHLRTFQLIDQADNLTVATTNLIGIYSPRTDAYTLTADPQSWWRSPDDGNYYYYSSGKLATEISFAQDYRGNRPTPMQINVWNLRFLEAQTIGPDAGVIEASLSLQSEPKDHSAPAEIRIRGTITNRGDAPLKNITLRAKAGTCNLSAAPPLAAGETMNVDQALNAQDKTFAQPEPGQPYNYNYYGNPSVAGTPPNQLAYPQACDLASDRSIQIDRLLKTHDDLICLYATADHPPPPVTLKPAGAREQHWQIIRAVIALEK